MTFDEKKIFLEHEYLRTKQKAAELFRRGSVLKAINEIHYAASIAWKFPIVHDFIDDDMESLLAKISTQVLPQNELMTREKNINRIIFYNGQIIDSGALTEQYLSFFMENNYTILFIVPNITNTSLGGAILRKLSEYSKATVLIPQHTDRISCIKKLYKAIVDFSPDIAFLHFLPNDVEGFTVFSRFPTLLRYYIVHNDHTFWLGKGCSNYFLEFRQQGINISHERRGIEKKNLIYLPFYPIDNGSEFQGFPFDRKGKIVSLSGAILYKYLLDPELNYFKVIKRLLIENHNLVFCLAGSGSESQISAIKEIFSEEMFCNQFFYLGKRSDFFALIGQIDLYFESFPLRGGLAVLFAINQKKPIVGIGQANDLSGLTEEFFDLADYHQPQTLDEFYREATRLINDEEYRASNVRLFSTDKFTKAYFDRALEKVIAEGRKWNMAHTFQVKTGPVDVESSLRKYLSLYENVIASIKIMHINSVCQSRVLRVLMGLYYDGKYFGLKKVVGRLIQKLITRPFLMS